MATSIRYLPAALVLLTAASPAWASGGIILPEPSGAFLLALGAAGVAIGRKFSTKRPKD